MELGAVLGVLGDGLIDAATYTQVTTNSTPSGRTSVATQRAQQTTARLNASVGLLVTTSTLFGAPAPANPAETGAGGVPAVVAATGTHPARLWSNVTR